MSAAHTGRGAALLLLGALALGAAPAADTFTGVVSDEMCASNHAPMRMGPTDAECTRACVEEHDAKYVLVTADHVYALSDPKAASPFAGEKVTVTGTLDAKGETIAVTGIARRQ